MPAPGLEIVPTTPADQPILANLLELYAHDFSEFLDIDVQADGRFGYDKLPLYWRDPNRHALLFKLEGKLAGFALIKQGSEISQKAATWDMAEFFILRRYRRHGIGAAAAHEIFRRFPGPWEVRVMELNPAHQFWDGTISQFARAPVQRARIQHNGKLWRVFSFESAP